MVGEIVAMPNGGMISLGYTLDIGSKQGQEI